MYLAVFLMLEIRINIGNNLKTDPTPKIHPCNLHSRQLFWCHSSEWTGKEISFPFDKIKLIYMKQKPSIFSIKFSYIKLTSTCFFLSDADVSINRTKTFSTIKWIKVQKNIFFTTHDERLIEGRKGEDVVIVGREKNHVDNTKHYAVSVDKKNCRWKTTG